jgi:hypothetical protein
MTERMHPEDLRAIVASTMWADDMTVSGCLKMADCLLAELARTAKPEDTGKIRDKEFWFKKANEMRGLCVEAEDRAEKAEARVKELEARAQSKPDTFPCAKCAAETDVEPSCLCHACQKRSDEGSPATEALNAIAALCGCPEWEYPGQIVRDVDHLSTLNASLAIRVEALSRDLAKAKHDRDRYKDWIDTVNTKDAAELRSALAAEVSARLQYENAVGDIHAFCSEHGIAHGHVHVRVVDLFQHAKMLGASEARDAILALVKEQQ